MKVKSQQAAVSFESSVLMVGGQSIVRLPEGVSATLPSRGQVVARGTINGCDLQAVLEPDGSWGHWFKVDEKLQKVLGVHVGDSVTLKITPSKDWPEPEVPTDFLKALETAPSSVCDLWTKITPMARWEWIRWVNATSNIDTRARRVEVSISKLQSGKRRPCCFNLSACTDPELSKNGRLIEPAA